MNSLMQVEMIPASGNKNEIVYFDSFGVEHVPEEIKEFIGNKNIKHFSSASKRFSNVWLLLHRIY